MHDHQPTDEVWIRGLVDKHFVAAYTEQKLEHGREPTDLEIADFILSRFADISLREPERRKQTLDALADYMPEYKRSLELAPPAESD